MAYPLCLSPPSPAERQQCAAWVKKLCDPASCGAGVTGRKNRNMHARLLLHMLKRGVLERPFTSRPEPGGLKALPTYVVRRTARFNPSWFRVTHILKNFRPTRGLGSNPHPGSVCIGLAHPPRTSIETLSLTGLGRRSEDSNRRCDLQSKLIQSTWRCFVNTQTNSSLSFSFLVDLL